MKPNRSVLSCPTCEKPLVNIGSKVARIHPVARFIKDRYVTIIVAWIFLIPFIVQFVFWVSGASSAGRLGISFGLFALLLVPFIVNFSLLRLFPVYRITDCPYCGFHEKQRLGLSDSGEL